jgi:5-methylcytosine-specific restriction protein A
MTMAAVEQRDVEMQLRAAAAARGASVNVLPNGHFQIKGSLLVNYYPFAKKRTAYIAATTRGIHHTTISQAVALAFAVPPIADAHAKDARANSKRYRRWTRRMWNAGFRDCFWCAVAMNRVPGHPQQMTCDHRIPLARGGLDNPNNWVPACRKCNQERGHAMPEMRSDE